MSRRRRVPWISSIVLVVSLLIPAILLRQVWKEPTLRLVGAYPARSVSSSELPSPPSHKQHGLPRAEAAVRLAAATMSRLHRLAQAAWHLFEAEQAERLAFMPPAAAHPEAIAPPQPKIITLKPLSYVEKADGRAEATISLGERVQVVHEGEIFKVNFKVAGISSSTVELVENSAPAAEPRLMPEIGQGVAQAPAHKSRQTTRQPTPETLSKPEVSRQSPADSTAGPSDGQELGYVERADGRVEAIVADGEHVRLAPETKSFADSFRAPVSTPTDLEAANTVPPLINPSDSLGQESQPVQTDTSTQEAGVPPLVASRSESSSVGELRGISGNNGESGSEQAGIVQPEPLADYSGGRFEPRDVPPVPQVGPAGAAPSPAAAGSGLALKGGPTPPLPSKAGETQSAVSVLGYVEKLGGEEEAIVEAQGQVYLVHEGELSAEKYRALQGTASSAAAKAMPMPPSTQVLQEIVGSGAGGAIQGIFAVQVGAFRDRSNAERLKERIESQFRPVVIQDFKRRDGLFYCVRVGQASTEDAARALAQSLRKANLATETFAVRLK